MVLVEVIEIEVQANGNLSDSKLAKLICEKYPEVVGKLKPDSVRRQVSFYRGSSLKSRLRADVPHEILRAAAIHTLKGNGRYPVGRFAEDLGLEAEKVEGFIARLVADGVPIELKGDLIFERIEGDIALVQAKMESGFLRKQLQRVEKSLAELDKIQHFWEKAFEAESTQVSFAPPVEQVDTGKVSALALLSDAHWDEVVRAVEVMGSNAYNREIGVLRLQEFGANLVKLMRHYTSGVKYEGLLLAILGDMFSGNIHDELRETNEEPLISSVLFWKEHLVALIKFLQEELQIPLEVPCVVGNHPRMDKKPRAKNYVRDNFDYLLYKLLEREFKDTNDIKIDVSESVDKSKSVYSTRFLFTHGNQFRGGTGISGLLAPLMIGDARKRKRNSTVDMPYDYLAMGHWHERAAFKGILQNGTLKGYDEYAFASNFEFQEPQQLFGVIDPRHKVTITAPIWCRHPNEKW